MLFFCAIVAATPVSAMRIVSLAPSVTETLFALGAGDAVVGVSTYCDYPPAAAKITRVGTFLTPNVEVIIALQPDVVIAVPSPGNEAPVKTLEAVGLKIVVVDAQTVQQTRDSIAAIAQVIGRPAEGRQLLERMDARMQAVHERLREAPIRRVLMLVGEKPLVAVGGGTFQDELIRMARGVNVAGDTGLAWPHLSIEAVIAWAPEVIIDAAMGNEENGHGSEFWKQFPSLPAVHEGRVYSYPAYQLLRPGPRIPEALETIARFIHPEEYKDVQGPRSKVRGLGADCGFFDFGPWTLDFGLACPT